MAFADVKDEMLTKLRKQVARARLRPVNPLAGRSVAETLAPTAMDDKERWVFHLVSAAAISLKLPVGILVLQDSMGHYLVHFTQGKRLVTYRVDKAWVTDAMAGKADQRERISTAVDQYLRQEFLGQPIAPKAPAPAKPAPTAPPAVSATKPGAAAASTTPAATGGPSTPAEPATPTAAATPAATAQTGEMSREERIAAARAKAEAIRAQRAAGGQSPSPQPAPPSKDHEKP